MHKHPWPNGRCLVVCIVLLPLLGFVRPAEARGGPTRAVLRKASYTTPPSPVSGRRRSPATFTDWVFWYHHNADRLEAEMAPTQRIAPDGSTPNRHDTALRLLRNLIADEQEHGAIRANALRALARGLRDAPDVAILVSRLGDPKEESYVREGAAMGLGLMVRAGPRLLLPDSAWETVRRALFRVAQSDLEQGRLRGLAFCSLALLATQPGSGIAPEDLARRFAVWMARPDLPFDVSVGVLHALALLPPAAVSREIRERLGSMVRERKAGKERVPELIRAYAATALGRVGDAQDLEALLPALPSRRGAHAVRRSVAIALGRLGTRLPIGDRTSIVETALKHVERAKDATTRHLLLMALSRLLVAGSTSDTATLLEQTPVDRVLLRVADKGKYVDRGYAALGLGLAVRRLPAVGANEVVDRFRERAVETLRVGLHDRAHDVRAAFVMALGMARDADRAPTLRRMAADPQRSQVMRGYALLALALGTPTLGTHRLAGEQVQAAMGDLHGRLAVRVLGLTGEFASASTIALLGRVLRGGVPGAPSGEAAVALARTGRVEAADLLMAVAGDKREQDLFRSQAVVGLGRIVDPEHIPTLTRLTEGLNYRASTDLINELLSTL